MDELGKIMEQASHVISEVTNYPAIAVIKPPEGEVSRYETVLIDEHSFLLIMIGGNGTVRNRNVRLKSFVDQETLDALRKALNDVLLGTAIGDVSLPVVLKFEEALGQYAYLSTPILRVLYEMANATDTERVHVEGVTKLFSYPEFNNVTKAKGVLELIGEREKFAALLSDADPEKANVFIGGDDTDSPAARLELRAAAGDGGRQDGGRHRRHRAEADGLQKSACQSGLLRNGAVRGAGRT